MTTAALFPPLCDWYSQVIRVYNLRKSQVMLTTLGIKDLARGRCDSASSGTLESCPSLAFL
uniref:Uncharacterized protein n=1 Tax=Anguilla anguilla TaxID=7936 RepID=A0A0E9UXH7_ANGAN